MLPKNAYHTTLQGQIILDLQAIQSADEESKVYKKGLCAVSAPIAKIAARELSALFSSRH
jgi:hypothetical protein